MKSDTAEKLEDWVVLAETSGWNKRLCIYQKKKQEPLCVFPKKCCWTIGSLRCSGQMLPLWFNSIINSSHFDLHKEFKMRRKWWSCYIYIKRRKWWYGLVFWRCLCVPLFPPFSIVISPPHFFILMYLFIGNLHSGLQFMWKKIKFKIPG